MEKEKEFYLTSTISIFAKDEKDAIRQWQEQVRDENNQSDMAYELLNNAEITEAEENV